MAFKAIKTGLHNEGNLFAAIRSAVANTGFGAVVGAESLTDFNNKLSSGNVAGTESIKLDKLLTDKLNPKTFTAFSGAMARGSNVPEGDMIEIVKRTEQMYSSIGGLEGFSMQNFKGSEADIKAANMTLNAQSHLQTPAAEALFSTVTVKYEDEGALLLVRAAGLGNYAYGNSAWQQASELRPIFGLLRTGDMFRDEVLATYPVWPEEDDSDLRELFVDEAVMAPFDATYPENDAYGRQNHLTNYLRVPSNIPNFLGLCEAPGQRAWTSTDELESNSISADAIIISGTLESTAVNFFINTKSMSNNTFTVTSNGQGSDDRQMGMFLRRFEGFQVLDKTGARVGETLFAAFKTAGFEPLLDATLNGNFNRQTNTMRLSSGSAAVSALREIATGNIIEYARANDTQKALLRSLKGGSVTGMKQSSNVNNISRGNFGYRIEVFDANKKLSVRRGSPVSVKYPISKDDVNQDSLDYAINQMSIAINNQCSKKAFDIANEHLRYVTSIDGHPVVGNNQGSNVLPGQHYVTAAAVNRELTLEDTVSSVDSTGIFEAVSAVFTNELSDITAALNTKSGLAAIAEYGGTTAPKWSIIVHQNLSRFLMKTGDARTLGPLTSMKIIETNFDSQIGQILIVTENNSTSDFINPLGGIGVMVSKENIVVQGNVTRDQQDFGVVMTLPTYRHWPLNPIIGSLRILDAEKFLGDEGLLTKLGKQRVEVVGLQSGMQALTDATLANNPNP